MKHMMISLAATALFTSTFGVGTVVANDLQKSIHFAKDSHNNAYQICQDRHGITVTLPDNSISVWSLDKEITSVAQTFGLTITENVTDKGACYWPGGPRCQDKFCEDYEAINTTRARLDRVR